MGILDTLLGGGQEAPAEQRLASNPMQDVISEARLNATGDELTLDTIYDLAEARGMNPNQMADLSHCSLDGVVITQEAIDRAGGSINVRDANMHDTVWRPFTTLENAITNEGSNLSGARFEGITEKDETIHLEQGNFEGAQFNMRGGSVHIGRDAVASGLDMSGTQLATLRIDSGADVSNSNFEGARMLHLEAEGANLNGSNFSGVLVTETTNLQSASLVGADLSQANLRNLNLENANLHNADLSGADLSHANLRGAKLSSEHMQGANLNGADLRGATLDGEPITYEMLVDINQQQGVSMDGIQYGVQNPLMARLDQELQLAGVHSLDEAEGRQANAEINSQTPAAVTEFEGVQGGVDVAEGEEPTPGEAVGSMARPDRGEGLGLA